MILLDQKTAVRLEAADLPWKVRVENKQGKSNKFWEVESNGLQVSLNYGKIGTRGRHEVLSNGAEAFAKLSQKLRNRGYSYPLNELFVFPAPFDQIAAVDAGGVAFDVKLNKVLTLTTKGCETLKVIVANSSGLNAPRITFA